MFRCTQLWCWEIGNLTTLKKPIGVGKLYFSFGKHQPFAMFKELTIDFLYWSTSMAPLIVSLGCDLVVRYMI